MSEWSSSSSGTVAVLEEDAGDEAGQETAARVQSTKGAAESVVESANEPGGVQPLVHATSDTIYEAVLNRLSEKGFRWD